MLEDELLIFVITRDIFEVETVSVTRAKLAEYLNKYQKEVMSYPHYQDIGQSWLYVSECLIKPVEKYIKNADMIIFVPNDILHYLPLHALLLDDKPLIRKHPVVYSTSASLLQLRDSKGTSKFDSCLAVSAAKPKDGDILKALISAEAEQVGELFQTELVFNGTKSDVMSALAKSAKDITHFSCHGSFDSKDPLSSGILFHSPDGNIDWDRDILTAREIFNMKLGSELVTLSACETGLNKIESGDNLLGFTYSLLHAGAASVLVSLWSVNAASTKDLMIEFYKALKSGKSKALALQQAMIRIMDDKDHPELKHPYYWAPFVLVGDWE